MQAELLKSRCRGHLGETEAAKLGAVEGEIVVIDPKHRSKKRSVVPVGRACETP